MIIVVKRKLKTRLHIRQSLLVLPRAIEILKLCLSLNTFCLCIEAHPHLDVLIFPKVARKGKKKKEQVKGNYAYNL